MSPSSPELPIIAPGSRMKCAVSSIFTALSETDNLGIKEAKQIVLDEQAVLQALERDLDVLGVCCSLRI